MTWQTVLLWVTGALIVASVIWVVVNMEGLGDYPYDELDPFLHTDREREPGHPDGTTL